MAPEADEVRGSLRLYDEAVSTLLERLRAHPSSRWERILDRPNSYRLGLDRDDIYFTIDKNIESDGVRLVDEGMRLTVNRGGTIYVVIILHIGNLSYDDARSFYGELEKKTAGELAGERCIKPS